MKNLKPYILLVTLFLLASCSKEVAQIKYGTDQCENCKMTLTDKKYGALIYTQKGKSFKFDAAECLLDYVKENKISESEIDKYFVINLTEPGELINAAETIFLISPELRSPMGENISAFKNKADAEKYQTEFGGEIFSWDELKNKFVGK
ncbi:MAG: nitrous oxide reductase accessory protein NosL [Ignavibacteria bacterium]|nr:nitrous oxide reductase accessory protein NosL [Ignavibacteria bacterium]